MNNTARFLRGLTIGVVAGGVLVAVFSGDSIARAVQMDPFRLRDGTFGACANWRDDNAPWKDGNGDGVVDPFKYWWSGHSRFWNLAGANGCWHSDEGWTTGDPNRPSVDYQGGTGTDVYFRADHWNAYNWWPAVYFEATGCRGLQARVYSPTGVFLSKIHYWHVEPLSGVIGTNWTYHYDVPGYSLAYRQVADVAASDGSCYITGPHLHQSADDPTGGSQAERTGDVVNGAQFYLTWSN